MRKIILTVFLYSVLLGCAPIQVRDEFPEDADYKNAEAYFLSGNYEAAISNYEVFLTKQKIPYYMPEAYYRIGLSYFALGRYSKASEALSRSLNKNPSSVLKPEIYSALARIYMFQKDYPSAVTYFKKTLSAQEGDQPQDEIIFNLATALIRCGKWDDGYYYFKKLIGQYPFSPLAEIALDRLYLPSRVFIVQLGKFEVKENALNELALLHKEKDIKASLKTIFTENSEVYFIWVGNFSSWTDAFKKAEEIQNKGVEAIVIP